MIDSLANKYAPKRFSDVWGQEFTVRCLSNLIKRGQIGRHLLFHGSVGSGKTSLARLYARALNCLKPDDDGSPCMHCQMCLEELKEAGFFEYDTSGIGSEKLAGIRQAIEPLMREPTERRYTVIFFDEAHALERTAADSLLKVIEDAPRGVVFCFATTEAHRLRPALRSRLLDLEVRPLIPGTAIAFLQDIAGREQIDYEPEALALLAGLKPRYPRDLINGLDLVHECGQRVTVESVRAAFDVDHADRLVEYFLALADGDIAEQTKLLLDWHESVEDKAAWIQSFLTSLYYNDILGRNVVVDALSHSIKRRRPEVVRRFCQRLQLAEVGDLAPYWHSLMEFWREPAADQGEHAIALRLALFQHRVSYPAPEAIQGAHFTVAHPSSSGVQGFDSDRALYWSAPTRKTTDIRDQFFHHDDARELINRASYLLQFFGIALNASFTITAASFGVSTEIEAKKLVRDFCRDLDVAVRIDADGASLALLVCFERRDEGLTATVLAHIRSAASSELHSWCEAWRKSSRRSRSGIAIRVKFATKREGLNLKFHWDQVLSLCRDLDDTVKGWDVEREEYRPLREMLKVARSVQGGRTIGMQRVIAGGLLNDRSLAAQQRLRMAPLSAFDDEAWAEIRSGWELAEHRDRQLALNERCDQLKLVKVTHGTISASQFRQLMQSWPKSARLRVRSWQFWGRSQDV